MASQIVSRRTIIAIFSQQHVPLLQKESVLLLYLKVRQFPTFEFTQNQDSAAIRRLSVAVYKANWQCKVKRGVTGATVIILIKTKQNKKKTAMASRARVSIYTN